MKKKDLVKAISVKSGYTQKDINVVIDALMDTITSTLANGEEVNIAGFGKFVVNDKPEGTAVNPRTGEKITVAAKRVARFKPSLTFKNAVAGVSK